MGDRANYAVRCGGAWQLWYAHWGATTLTGDLFWGPESALAFVRRQSAKPWDAWLDEVWCQGGAVIDVDERVLLLFGGATLLFDVPLRRLYLDWLARVWSGWTVKWAFEGVSDLARAAGVPVERVLDDVLGPRGLLFEPEQPEWNDVLVSVRRVGGGLELFGMVGEQPVLVGPEGTLAAIDSQAPAEQLVFDEWPVAGIHVDEGARVFVYWFGADVCDCQARLQERVSDWELRFLAHDYEAQLGLLGDRVELPSRSDDDLARELAELLLAPARDWSPESLLYALEARGASVREINPHFLQREPLELATEDRCLVLERIGVDLGILMIR